MQANPTQTQPGFFATLAQETWVKDTYHLMPPDRSTLLGSCDCNTLGAFKLLPPDIIALILYWAGDDCIVNSSFTNSAFSNVSLSLRFSHRFNAEGHKYVQHEVANGRYLHDVLLTCPAAQYRAINWLPIDPEGLHILRTDHGLDAGPVLLQKFMSRMITLEDARKEVADYPARWMRIFNKDSDVYPENELESCSYYYHKDFLPYIDPKTLMDAYKAAMTAETPTVTPPTPHALKYIFGGGVWIDWYCNSQVKWEGEFENSIKLLDSIEIMNLVDLNILNISRIGVRLGQALFPLEVEEKDSDKDRIRTCLTFKEISSCVASNVLTLEGIIKITRTKNAWQLTQTERPVRSSNLRLLFLLIAKQEVRDLILKDKEVTINRLLSDFSKQDVVKFEKEQDPVPQNILDIIKKGQSHFVRDFKDRQFEAKRISNEIAATVTRWYNFNFSPFGGPSGIDQIY